LHDLSPRWDKPFVAVNCGAIPTDLMESELFGHAKGAFTGAADDVKGRIRSAADGTLLLDEIGELPLALQPKLLRVLETKMVDPVGGPQSVAVDFRLICATNKDLTSEVQAGRFREDLYYRLEVVRLEVPPLRERPEDIPVLWQHFTRLNGGEGVRSDPQLLFRLTHFNWRGNVRELMNLNQRLVLMRRGDTLTEADLDRAVAAKKSGSDEASNGEDEVGGSVLDRFLLGPLPEKNFSLPDVEKEIIRRALVKCGGNKSRTAAYLGLPRHVLVYRLEKYNL